MRRQCLPHVLLRRIGGEVGLEDQSVVTTMTSPGTLARSDGTGLRRTIISVPDLRLLGLYTRGVLDTMRVRENDVRHWSAFGPVT